VFSVAAVSFLGAVVVQHKGFNYHYYPAFAFACVSLLMSVAEWGGSRRRWLFVVPVIVVGAGMLYLAATRLIVGLVLGEENRRLTLAYTAVVESNEPAARDTHGARFVVLSTNLVHSFPMATNMGLQWPIRFPSLWPLIVRPSPGCALTSIPKDGMERKFRDDLWEDLRRTTPEFIVSAPLPPVMQPRPGCMTVSDHLAVDDRFARFFAAYSPVDTIRRVVHGPFAVLRRR
jgi:hypothetical protein